MDSSAEGSSSSGSSRMRSRKRRKVEVDTEGQRLLTQCWKRDKVDVDIVPQANVEGSDKISAEGLNSQVKGLDGVGSHIEEEQAKIGGSDKAEDEVSDNEEEQANIEGDAVSDSEEESDEVSNIAASAPDVDDVDVPQD